MTRSARVVLACALATLAALAGAACLSGTDKPEGVTSTVATGDATLDAASDDAPSHEAAHPGDTSHAGDSHEADAHPDAGSCKSIAITGAAPACLLEATCAHGTFTFDCRDAGAGCLCPASADAGVLTVPYDPRFCGISDGGYGPGALELAIMAAHEACGYKHY